MLYVMPIEEDRNDQRREYQPVPECIRIAPDLRTRSHERKVHEAKERTKRDEPVRRAIGTLDMRAIDAVNPGRLQVQEDEEHVADVRDRQDQIVS